MSRPQSLARRIAGAKPRVGRPAKGKAIAIRTARDRNQALNRVKKEITNLTHYGVPASRLLGFVAEIIETTEETIQD